MPRTPWDRLALVPARRSADLPAVLGWRGQAPTDLLHAQLRSWEERFGAELVALRGGELHLAVARPPQSPEQAELLALEHRLSTADSVTLVPFPEYAAQLVGCTRWELCWD
ncbi:DUF4253 domain-containing protein [Kitasatospora sp. NPDC006697]|uniref:DUF4253 domain-containing protein n=1 Tax=Kitasatospora sp. NPDC006697 TaxID=3364020 RepID=UPI00369FFD44